MSESTSGTRAIVRLLPAVIGVLLLAYAYQYRRGGVDDPVAAVRMVAVRMPALRADIGIDQYGSACDAGDLPACVELGLRYAAVRDDGRAPLPPCLDHALFEHACDRRSWRGCQEVARTSRRGDCGQADFAYARDVLDAECQRMVFAACDAKAEL